MKYNKGTRVSIRSIKLSVDAPRDHREESMGTSMEIEYHIHGQVETPIKRKNAETGEVVEQKIKKVKPMTKGVIIFPLDGYDRLEMDLSIEEYEDMSAAWECLHKLKAIAEKVILMSQIDSSFLEPDTQQIVVDLKDLEGENKNEENK